MVLVFAVLQKVSEQNRQHDQSSDEDTHEAETT